MAIHLFLAIITFAIPPKLNAVELSTLCAPNSRCEIRTPYPLVTNHGTTIITPTGYTGYDDGIYVESATITSFINYGKIITNTKDEQRGTFSFAFVGNNGNIQALTNYGTISGGVNANSSSIHITNYGTMGGVSTRGSVTIANYGEINLLNGNGKKHHFKNQQSLTLQNYAMKISEKASVFNAFNGQNATDNSHLVVDNVQGVKFANRDSGIILDFGNGFELGTGYLFSKLVVDTSGANKLNVGFDRLIPRSDIYHITQQGDSFVVNLKPEHSTIGNLHKSNIRTMNNFYTISNSMIYPHKYKVGMKRVPKKKRVIRRVKKISALDSIESLESLTSNETFKYKNNSTDSTNRNNQNRPKITATNQNTNYHFILTPFINHNLFFESGRYNLSGLDYGFLTAFSGKLTQSNALGTHFMMSYGNLGDSTDKNFNIKNLNLNVGVNYKLDLIWDMFIKARGDFFYFLNQVKMLTIFKAIKPNTLGFGVSVAYGKDFNFGNGGILGIEGGIDYKALQSSTIELHNNTYQKNLYNLIYIDLGLNYNKYFNTSIGLWGINTFLGIKGNITANKLSKSQIHINNLNRDVNMVLDNDKILAYANISASYVLNHKDFDMEFSLQYFGNFGDRGISNGGGVEWRTTW